MGSAEPVAAWSAGHAIRSFADVPVAVEHLFTRGERARVGRVRAAAQQLVSNLARRLPWPLVAPTRGREHAVTLVARGETEERQRVLLELVRVADCPSSVCR